MRFFGTAFWGPPWPCEPRTQCYLKECKRRPKSWQCKNTQQRAWPHFATHSLKTGTTHTEKMPGELGSRARRPFYRFPYSRPPPRHGLHGGGLVPPSSALLMEKWASLCLIIWKHLVAGIRPKSRKQILPCLRIKWNPQMSHGHPQESGWILPSLSCLDSKCTRCRQNQLQIPGSLFESHRLLRWYRCVSTRFDFRALDRKYCPSEQGQCPQGLKRCPMILTWTSQSLKFSLSESLLGLRH